MDYEFKKLSEVAVAESVTDETSVLIEEDGVIKKTARKNIGNVKSVNGVEPDDTGDVAFDYVKSVNGVEVDTTGNVTIHTSSQVVYYIENPLNPYIFKDSSLTTKETATGLQEVIDSGSSIVFNMGNVGIFYPIAIRFGTPMTAIVLMGQLYYFYTAEYVEES